MIQLKREKYMIKLVAILLNLLKCCKAVMAIIVGYIPGFKCIYQFVSCIIWNTSLSKLLGLVMEHNTYSTTLRRE